MMSDQLKTFYKVADIIVSIEGNNVYAEALRKYFINEEIHQDECVEQFLIRVNEPINDSDFEPEYYSLSGTIAFNAIEYRVRKSNFIYRVKNLFDNSKTTVLNINWTRKATVGHYLINHMRAKNIGVYSNADKFVDSIMNYEVFLYIFAMILMKYNKVFVHSAIVEYKGDAIVITGTSGCGKTSTLLQFLEKQECKYISEDFSIIDDNGNVYFTPKKMAVYQSDAKYKNKNVLKALKGMTVIEKFYWNIFKIMGQNPRHRFDPHEFFGVDKISKVSKVKKVIYMSRKENTEINKCELSEKEIVEKISYASFRELRELYEVLYNIRAVGDEKIREAYPPLEHIQTNYKTILEKALKNGKTGLLEVPLKISPIEIVSRLAED